MLNRARIEDSATGPDRPGRIGVWMIGAYGEIAVTVMVGAAAAGANGAAPDAMVSALPPFDRLALADVSDLVFGGCDILQASATARAAEIACRSRTFDRHLSSGIRDRLESWDAEIFVDPSLAWRRDGGSDRPLAEVTARLREAIAGFRQRNRLDQVVVVNLTSVDDSAAASSLPSDPDRFVRLIEGDRRDLVSPAMASAYAAFSEGCGYVNFTPNLGPELPALTDLAIRSGVPWCGSDGKTGETMLKTVLAPMFRNRNLQVLSWEGINLLGNNDGRALQEPDRARSKLRNKQAVLDQALGYRPHSGVDIRYVPSLGDWKTAWDFIHFEGFLGVQMSMQLIWQGCDSILAAPLVLDLARFTGFALEQKQAGALRHLASFFKCPAEVVEQDFFRQYEMLVDYARRHLQPDSRTAAELPPPRTGKA